MSNQIIRNQDRLIKAMWEVINDRRCELISIRINSGRSAKEEREFKKLQRVLMLYRRVVCPLPVKELKKLLKGKR